MSFTFVLDEKQEAVLREWEKEQDKETVKKQQQDLRDGRYDGDPFRRHLAEVGEPYYGTIGGSLTFKFTPTSLGAICVVEHNVTKATINLTDYDSW